MTADGKHSCSRCRGERRVYNGVLKRRIRCPQCTTRRRRDERGIREFVEHDRKTISAPERARMIERVERSLREAIGDTFADAKIPEHLRTTHRILERWAAEGTGKPAENDDVYHESRPPPLDPPTYAVVEAVIATLVPRLRSLVKAWYRSRASNKQLAERRGITVRTLGRWWQEGLAVIRDRFLASRHADLIALVRMQA